VKASEITQTCLQIFCNEAHPIFAKDSESHALLKQKCLFISATQSPLKDSENLKE
jgi:hypothetical protein